MIHTILLVFGFVLEVLAAAGIQLRFNLTAAGLACWIASLLFGSL